MIALSATLITLIILVVALAIVWIALVRPVITKTEHVMDQADLSHDLREQREKITDEERQSAEQELEIDLHVENKNE